MPKWLVTISGVIVGIIIFEVVKHGFFKTNSNPKSTQKKHCAQQCFP